MRLTAPSLDTRSGTDERPAAVDPLQARVDAAAFALLREGRNPTVALVRARMGGGSPNIVAPALQRWRLTFAAQLDSNTASALEVLPPGVLELVQALWSRALFEAHRVRAESTSTVDAVEQLTATLRDLQALVARLEEREAQLDEQLRALDHQRRRIATVSLRRIPRRSPVRKRIVKAARPRKAAKKGKSPVRSRPAPAPAKRRRR